MLNLGNVELCGHNTKTLAANAAAPASSKSAAQTGKSGNMMVDTSCHHLSKRDLSYFSSERFEKTLKLVNDQILAKRYGSIIVSRKKEVRKNDVRKAWEVVDAIIYVDIFDAHYDGHPFFYEEVRALFKGYRSQALREMKKTKGFNALVYKTLAKALEDKGEARSFLRAISAPVLREKPML